MCDQVHLMAEAANLPWNSNLFLLSLACMHHSHNTMHKWFAIKVNTYSVSYARKTSQKKTKENYKKGIIHFNVFRHTMHFHCLFLKKFLFCGNNCEIKGVKYFFSS